MATPQSLKIDKWTGLNNVDPPEHRPPGDLDAARNVDIDDKGQTIRRRKGSGTAVYSGSVHSLWSDGATTLFRESTGLKRLNPDYSATSLQSGIYGGRKMAYLKVLDRIYYSDSVFTGVLDGGACRSWGLDVPPMPTLTATAGDLAIGKYQVVITYVRNDGQEGGASESAMIDLTSGGGITISGIPVPSDSTIDAIRIYMTATDGEVFFLLGWIDPGTTTATYRGNGSDLIYPLKTQFLSPAPAGHLLGFFKSRVFVASDRVLFHSEPFAYELFNLAHNLHLYDSRITLLGPRTDGIWISTQTETFYLAGTDPGQFQKINIAQYPAIEGTACEMYMNLNGKDTLGWMWASTRGVCFGTDQGFFLNFTEHKFNYPVAPAGGAMVRQKDGMNHYVVALQDARGDEFNRILTPDNLVFLPQIVVAGQIS